MAAEPKRKERRAGGRRKLDKIMEKNISAIRVGQGKLSQSLQAHLVDCARKSEVLSTKTDGLKTSVDRVLDFVEPQIKKAQDRAAVWKKVSETVTTDGMVFAIKAIVIVAVVSVAYGIVPAIRALFGALIATLTG
jgi:hypothetical protein